MFRNAVGQIFEYFRECLVIRSWNYRRSKGIFGQALGEGAYEGRRVGRAAVGDEADRQAQGKAAQVEPMKSTLKAPGTKRLKLEYNELLSSLLSISLNSIP